MPRCNVYDAADLGRAGVLIARILFALSALLLLINALMSAPAPTHRPRRGPEPTAPAAYDLDFAGQKYVMTLSPGGAYEAVDPGCVWTGSWTIHNGELIVRERCGRGDGPYVFTWSLPVSRACEGPGPGVLRHRDGDPRPLAVSVARRR